MHLFPQTQTFKSMDKRDVTATSEKLRISRYQGCKYIIEINIKNWKKKHKNVVCWDTQLSTALQSFHVNNPSTSWTHYMFLSALLNKNICYLYVKDASTADQFDYLKESGQKRPHCAFYGHVYKWVKHGKSRSKAHLNPYLLKLCLKIKIILDMVLYYLVCVLTDFSNHRLQEKAFMH